MADLEPNADEGLSIGDPALNDAGGVDHGGDAPAGDPVSQRLENAALAALSADNSGDPSLGGDPALGGNAPGGPAQQQAPPAAAPTAYSVRDHARAYGLYDIGNATDEQAATQALLANYLNALQYSQIGQQYAPHREYIEQALAARGQHPNQQGFGVPNQVQTQAAVPANPLGAPPWDRTWEQYIITDPVSGKTDWRAGTPADVVAAVTKFGEWRQNFDRQWQTDPAAALKPLVDQAREEIRRELQGDFDNKLQSRETHSEMRGFIDQHAGWIYQNDPVSGQMMRDPMTGVGLYTPAGARLHQHIAAFRQDGIQDPRRLLARSMQALQADMHAQQVSNAGGAQGAAAHQAPPAAPAAQQPANPRANQNHRILRGHAAKLAGRGQSVVASRKPGGPAQNPNASIQDMLRAEFEREGVFNN